MRAFLFEILEGLRIAARAIWVNKLRSVLTTLGIIIGIAAVTGMATVINGIDQQFEATLSQFGADVIHVRTWPLASGPGTRWWEYRNRPRIQPEIADAINQRSELTEVAVPVVTTSRGVSRGGRSLESITIRGSEADFARVHDLDLADGRFFTDFEARSADPVCVLGATVATELFPSVNPVGETIRVGPHRCRVIGTQERQGAGAEGSSEDNEIRIPFDTFDRFFGARDRSVDVQVKVGGVEWMDRAADEVTGIVRLARGLGAMEEDNFEVATQEDVRAQFAPVRLAIFGVGLFLTALALVVGGIGVMNIMFVSVKERTREIGIRKAVGAKRRTILVQFLIEAIIVCLIGGAIGVGLTAGLTTVITSLIGFEAVLPMGTVVLAFVICTAVGVIFGIAPAWQAAKAEPIEALRYE